MAAGAVAWERIRLGQLGAWRLKLSSKYSNVPDKHPVLHRARGMHLPQRAMGGEFRLLQRRVLLHIGLLPLAQ